MKKQLLILASVVFFLVSCGTETETANDTVANKNESISNTESALFELLSPERTNIDFENTLEDDPAGVRNVLSFFHYFHGAGIAVGDVNNDGLPDVFFSGNEVESRLYLNKGNLKFEDITKKANVNAGRFWATGATMVDINNDGFLDIYVCQYGPYPADKRKNLFYINNGDLTFSEKAEELGLADNRRSIQAAFFDYDKDGDLDCYVMNESRYAQTILKTVFDHLKDKNNLIDASGHMYRNDGGKFTEVTEAAGMLRYGYGLGLAVSDINDDGWLDVYVANDYSVPDFMFINNQDGTFTDKVKEYTEQISFYSMGVDIADINNDALVDIAVVDMAADDHIRDKTLMASMNSDLFWNYINDLDYHYQYMFNAFQLNNGNKTFSNVANILGVARTDWSWSTLLADFDNDGNKDYFVTNGFRRYARDNDFRNKMQEVRVANNGQVPLERRRELYDMMPQIKLSNLMYQNQGDLMFKQVQNDWGLSEPSYSNGAVYADLDNDGDLDIIVSNIDQKAFVYQNSVSDQANSNYFQVKLEGTAADLPGTKVKVHANGQVQLQEWMNTRGYQSSVGRVLHFGLGSTDKIDKLEIIWTNGKVQTVENQEVSQMFIAKKENATQLYQREKTGGKRFANEVNIKKYGAPFVHHENKFDDFKKEILLPHKQSTLGPFITKGDVNGDGLEDFFVGGAVAQPSMLYLQTADKKFKAGGSQPWRVDKRCEDMGGVFFDADGDEDLDLYVVSGGGGDVSPQSNQLQDRLYLNIGNGNFEKQTDALPQMLSSGSKVTNVDYDLDGDQDLFVCGQALPGRYPFASRSYLLRNDDGKFTDITNEASEDLMSLGIVKDAIWVDINQDGKPDLVTVGEWSSVRIFLNKGTTFSDESNKLGVSDLKGWWYSINAADLDADGDQDLVLGNIGLNTKFVANKKKTFQVFADDFDENGTTDVVLTKQYKGKLVPTRGRQCSSEQMPFIAEKFPTFNGFAHAGVEDILGDDKMKSALKLEANEFHSLVLMNENGKFVVKYLPNRAQISPINSIVTEDIDEDGILDLLVAGNNYDTEVETPRYDAGQGLFLKGKGNGTFEVMTASETGFLAPGNVKDLKILHAKGEKSFIVVARNNDKIQLFEL